MSRTLTVVRMQFVNRQTFVWVPLIVLGGAFVLTLAVGGLLQASGTTGVKMGGGLQAPMWYLLVIGVQSLTLTFPFSQAMSITRREFFTGTLVAAAGSAALLALIVMAGGAIESATNGWWMQTYFFTEPTLWAYGPLVAGLSVFVLSMLFFTIGFCSATIYKRFGPLVLTVALTAVGLAGVFALMVIVMFGHADAVAAALRPLGYGGFLAIVVGIAAALAAVSFGVLRRATP